MEISTKRGHFGLEIASWGCPPAQATPELLKGGDLKVSPGACRVWSCLGEATGSCQIPSPHTPHSSLWAERSSAFTGAPPQALLEPEPRSQPEPCVTALESAVRSRRGRCLEGCARPEPGNGFVFAGMRSCFVRPKGTRETRAARRPARPLRPPGTFRAPARGPPPLFGTLA